MDSPLTGRLRNTHLPFSKGLMPVYEAVINSIEAIEEANEEKHLPLSEYSIKLEIVRNWQKDLLTENLTSNPIIDFRITDNGIGFTEANWISFKTLDSLWKAKKGCRGIGRVLWLKAFENVSVDSHFEKNGSIRRRKFVFNVGDEVSDLKSNIQRTDQINTVVNLEGFKEKYAVEAPKTLRTIASGLLEHCLWYFIRTDGVPSIEVHDGDQTVDLFNLFEDYMHASSLKENFQIKDQEFEVTHAKIRISHSKEHTLGYCATGRLVKEENLRGRIPGLFSGISDNKGEFTYMAYLTSEYLDSKVTTERLNFNIQESVNGLYSGTEVSYEDIRSELYPRVENYLKDNLSEILNAGREKLETFVSNHAPKYRPLLNHIPPEKLSIDPNISNKDLDMLLHRETFEVEQDILDDGHDLLVVRKGEDSASYFSRIKQYLEKITDLKQADLANYVAHRRVVINLLSEAISEQDDSKFSREELIHDLIVPLQVTSSDEEFRRQNLWLLDERLAFHSFLASDKSISTNPTTTSTSMKRPDIATQELFDNPLLVGNNEEQQASITVVEIKKPMRNDFSPGESENSDPILQGLGYLRRLREGASTVNGRPIPNARKIPGFVYVLGDLTTQMIDCCKLHQLQITADGMGYFGYHRNEQYNAYIQVISYDGLVASATERNRAFFDRLGLPSS